MISESGNTHGPQATYRPKPDGKTHPAAEAGWYLQRERERRGISLQAAGRSIGVHPVHLQAIEMGDLANLPERAVALRIIGDYARFLGFEAKPLVEHYEKCLPEEAQNAKACSSARVIPFPLLARLRDMARTPAGLTASVATLTLLFGGLVWAMWPADHAETANGGKPVVAQATPTVNADKRPLRTVPSLARVEEKALSDAAPALASDAEADPIGALITRTISDLEEQAQQAPEASPAAPGMVADEQPTERPAHSARRKATDEQARAAAADTPGGRIVRPVRQVPAQGLALKAAEEIWVRLEDDHGATWYSGFLRPGDVLALPKGRTLRLTAGDVHRLEWFANGRNMGRLGQRGEDFISEPLKRLYQQAGLAMPSAG